MKHDIILYELKLWLNINIITFQNKIPNTFSDNECKRLSASINTMNLILEKIKELENEIQDSTQ